MQAKRAWSSIEECLKSLVRSDGGFTLAQRGFVRCSDGEELFVKIGVDDQTKAWAAREITTYRFLARHSYPYIPQLITSNEDETGFALEALKVENGWDWTNSWTDERLMRTIEAMDALAELAPAAHEVPFFTGHGLSVSDDGWISLAGASAVRAILVERMRDTEWSDLLADVDFTAAAEQSSRYDFARDSLVHNDIRADNCAWNAMSRQVRLVDWNWTQLNDRRIDLSAFLVSVQRSGFDVMKKYSSRLDAKALQWLAGYWFNCATRPIWAPNRIDMRANQLQSGVIAYNWAREMV